MKKLLKENFKILIIVLITTVVASVTTIFAYSLVAGDVGYTPHDTTWNVENVEAALNNLNLRENQLDTHFSTEEQVVGRWIGGKPIYQKTYLIQKTDNTTEFLLPHGLTNVTITNISGIIQLATGTAVPLVYNWVENNGNGHKLALAFGLIQQILVLEDV